MGGSTGRPRPRWRPVRIVAMKSSFFHEPRPVSFLSVMLKELTILGSIEYPPDFGEMLRLLERRDLGAMIKHRFPLARFSDALAAARDQNTAGKVLIEMEGD